MWHFENTEVEYGRMQAVELVKYLENVSVVVCAPACVGLMIPGGAQALARPDVEVIRYDYSRIIEVRPRGTSKGFALKRIMERVLNNDLPMNSPLMRSPSMPVNSLAAAAAAASSTSAAPAVTPPHPERTSPRQLSVNVSRHQRRSSDDAGGASGGPTDSPFIIVVGDDKSDEEMFRVLQSSHFGESPPQSPTKSSSLAARRMARSSVGARRSSNDGPSQPINTHSFTVCVGIKPSTAHFFLQDPAEVVGLIQAMGSATVKSMRRTFSSQGALGDRGTGTA